MRAIHKYILAVLAVLAFAPLANAQNYVEQGGIALNKSVSGPVNGQYTITLEAFTTGTVSVTEGIAPADIVLVLDYSTSMGNFSNSSSAMSKLRPAVCTFVNKIKSTMDDVIADGSGKHRIAFVLYSHDVYDGITGLNSFQNAEDLTVSGSQVLLNRNNLLGWDNRPTGTASGLGMEKANSIIKAAAQHGDYTDKDDYKNSARSRIVVWFTDGQPTGADRSEAEEGTACINAANTIKNTYGGTVYSVGLFTSGTSTTRATRESTFLSWTSSDFTDKTSYPPEGRGYPRTHSDWTKVSDKYSFLVDNADKLEQIFRDISDEAGQSGASLGSSSTVTVDVLSASFTLPKNADKNNITTYVAKCTGAEKDSNGNYITFTDSDGTVKIKNFLFGDKVKTSETPKEGSITKDFTAVAVDDSEFNKDIISVKGFDYEENFCAIEKDNGAYTDKASGYKLIIEIPIIINPESVGGPNTATNDPKSGVYLTDDEGHRLPNPALAFNQPTVPVPVNLVIRKLGLNKGESAKFVLQRTDAYDASGKLLPVSQATWNTFESSATWTPLTTFVLTGDGNAYVEHSITGLSDRYYYRILEEDGTMIENANWSWSYTGSAMTFTNSYQQLKNPFIFNNKKGETTRKHAESVVTNKFKAGETPVTVDSREFFKETSSK